MIRLGSSNGEEGVVFLGTHTPRLDDKGRLFLPAKFRDRLASGLVVTRGQERCLYVFPMDEFVRVAETMRNAPVTSKVVRDYLRVFLSGASDEIPVNFFCKDAATTEIYTSLFVGSVGPMRILRTPR